MNNFKFFEITSKALDDGWNVESRAVPKGFRSLHSYFDDFNPILNISKEDQILYDFKKDQIKFPNSYKTEQIMEILKKVNVLKEIYNDFKNEKYEIILSSGFSFEKIKEQPVEEQPVEEQPVEEQPVEEETTEE